MDIIDIDSLRKRAQRTKSKKMTSEIMLGKMRHSEVSQLTVTRILGNDTECKRRVQTYKDDMCFTVNNIKRQQNKLRRSMAQYSRKLRHNRKEREQREKQKREEFAQHRDVLPPILEEEPEEVSVTEDDNLDTVNNEQDETAESQDVETVNEVDPISVLTPIPEQQIEEVPETPDEDEKLEQSMENRKDTSPMVVLTEHLSHGTESKTHKADTNLRDFGNLDLKLYSKKKRKKQNRAVSYSDLIKLQHSSNTKKLFTLVDKLSKRHDPIEHEQDTKRGTSSKPVAPIRRSSVFYAINYGYDVPVEEPEPEPEPELVIQAQAENVNDSRETEAGDNDSLAYSNLFSEADNQFWRELHQRRKSTDNTPHSTVHDSGSDRCESKKARRRRRASDLPLLVADYTELRTKVVATLDHTSRSNTSRHARTKLLPPLLKGSDFKQ